MTRTHKRSFLGKGLIRGLLLAGAVVLVPSCSSGGGDSTAFQDFLIDDFDGGLGNWTVVSPSVTVNGAGIGRGPSMRLAAQAGVPAEARTVATFAVGSALTISIDSFVGSSISEIVIVDNASPAVRDTYAFVTDNSVHFSILGQTHLLTFPVDSFVHKFLFHAESGVAQWQRDGITYLTAGYSPTTVFVVCRDLDSGSDFDLVHISTP